jgi:hypothetical protein
MHHLGNLLHRWGSYGKVITDDASLPPRVKAVHDSDRLIETISLEAIGNACTGPRRNPASSAPAKHGLG